MTGTFRKDELRSISVGAFRVFRPRRLQLRAERAKIPVSAYSLSIVWPVFDAVLLSIQHKRAAFLPHSIYVYYAMAQICFQSLLKLLGKWKGSVRHGYEEAFSTIV